MLLDYPDPELRSDTVRIRKWAYEDVGCIRAAGTDPNIPNPLCQRGVRRIVAGND